MKFNKNPAKLKYGNTDLSERELRKNRVFTAEKAILNKISLAILQGFCAPDSGLFSKHFIEKLRRIGNFGEKFDLSQFQPDKNYKNRNF